MEENLKIYAFDYEHEGATWAIRFAASSPDDARARLHKIASAKFGGEVVAGIIYCPKCGQKHELVL